MGSSVPLKSGGVDADAEVVKQGYIAHMRTANENRWCVPEHIVNMDAVWFSIPHLQRHQVWTFILPECICSYEVT